MIKFNRNGPGLPMLVFLSIVTFIGSGAAYVFLVQYRHFRAYVSEEPTFIAAAPSPESGKNTLQRLQDFQSGNGGDTLALNSEEVNSLMAFSEPLKALDYGYSLEFRDSVFMARASVPLLRLQTQLSGLIRFLNLSGYVNSELTGYPRLENGKLELIPVAARMNNRDAPVNAIIKQGFVNIGDLATDPAAYADFLGRIADIRIRSGVLLLVRK